MPASPRVRCSRLLIKGYATTPLYIRFVLRCDFMLVACDKLRNNTSSSVRVFVK